MVQLVPPVLIYIQPPRPETFKLHPHVFPKHTWPPPSSSYLHIPLFFLLGSLWWTCQVRAELHRHGYVRILSKGTARRTPSLLVFSPSQSGTCTRVVFRLLDDEGTVTLSTSEKTNTRIPLRPGLVHQTHIHPHRQSYFSRELKPQEETKNTLPSSWVLFPPIGAEMQGFQILDLSEY